MDHQIQSELRRRIKLRENDFCNFCQTGKFLLPDKIAAENKMIISWLAGTPSGEELLNPLSSNSKLTVKIIF